MTLPVPEDLDALAPISSERCECPLPNGILMVRQQEFSILPTDAVLLP
jgi:hypothetical protein